MLYMSAGMRVPGKYNASSKVPISQMAILIGGLLCREVFSVTHRLCGRGFVPNARN